MPPFRKFLISSLFLILIGLLGLVFIFFNTLPTLAPRWFFFFFLFFLLTGLALPITAFINFRFPSDPLAEGSVVLRQALWFGVYIDVIAWLQMGRELTFSLALLILTGLVIIEILIRLGERSRWQPGGRNG